MSNALIENTTTVAGYFNPQKYSIYIEISEINLKTELAPNTYIRDRSGRYINDPIFEAYCHQKGLARATSDKPVPINFVPRFVKSERPVAAVTQAVGFVRQQDGRTAPAYATPEHQPRQVPMNKKPYTGMTMDQARKAGLVGKTRLLVPEDYGADETTGAPPKAQSIPGMKYSMESPPKVNTAAPLRPELLETDESLPPEERSRRQQLQTSIAQASSTAPPESFNPARVRPAGVPAPTPAPVPAKSPVVPIPPPKAAPKTSKTAPVKVTAPAAPAPPQRVMPKRRVAAPVQPEAEVEPDAQAPPDETPVVQEEPLIEAEAPTGSGIVQPLDESTMAAPVIDAPPPETESGKRFICAADGKPFNFRSELERHVRRNYPEMYDQLMGPYPA